jgi:hypothetical protein
MENSQNKQPKSPSIEEVKGQILKAKADGESHTKIQKLQQLLDRLISNV